MSILLVRDNKNCVEMDSSAPRTKILFLDNDEVAFEFRKCMASIIQSLPAVELYHAQDATEALGMLESLKPDVIVLDEEHAEENDLFLDSLSANHPPVVMQTEGPKRKVSFHLSSEVTCIEKDESLEGIHQTIIKANEVASAKSSLEKDHGPH